MMNPKALADYLYCATGMDNRPVGIKFLHSAEDYRQSAVPEVRSRISYCTMIKLTTRGNSFKTDVGKSLCPGAIRALGLEPPDSLARSGKRYYGLGMYDSLAIARNVFTAATVLEHQVFGLQTQPLDEWEDLPDVVLLIANPGQAMRIVQGYTYHFGLCPNIRLSGNQGICLELTARPFATNDLNLSLLCSNTRFSAKWRDSELGIGIPFNKLELVVDGLLRTIDPSETDRAKAEIAQRGVLLNVTLGNCYYRTK